MASETNDSGSALHWFLAGCRAAYSIPGLILMTAFVGFAGLAREAGLTLAQTVFMTAVVWALPGKVVMVGAILSGSGLIATSFAVALSSVRLLPMVVALVPEMKTDATRKWVLYLLSHYIAVTSWVIAMERFPGVPRQYRTAFYGGTGTTLMISNMVIVGVVFLAAASFPPAVAAGLFFLTPMYFLTSMWGTARETAGKIALGLGLALGPVFHLLAPQFDLLLAGLVGGIIAYGWHRLAVRNARP